MSRFIIVFPFSFMIQFHPTSHHPFSAPSSEGISRRSTLLWRCEAPSTRWEIHYPQLWGWDSNHQSIWGVYCFTNIYMYIYIYTYIMILVTPWGAALVIFQLKTHHGYFYLRNCSAIWHRVSPWQFLPHCQLNIQSQSLALIFFDVLFLVLILHGTYFFISCHALSSVWVPARTCLLWDIQRNITNVLKCFICS